MTVWQCVRGLTFLAVSTAALLGQADGVAGEPKTGPMKSGAEQPYWQQPAIIIRGATPLSTLDVDTVARHGFSRAGSRHYEGRGFNAVDGGGLPGLVMQWTQNMRISADGGIDAEDRAMTGTVTLHIDF